MSKSCWIKELPKDYYKYRSFFEEDVMLWQNGKVYVMDNHRDAAWCWLQQCNDDEQYNFMHIDMHYDMGDYFGDKDLIPFKNDRQMDYPIFESLMRRDRDCRTLRWDNYIRLVYELHPNWFKTNVFLTQKMGDIRESNHKNRMQLLEKDIQCMYACIDQYLYETSEYLVGIAEGSSELKWIVNLDLDVFFYHFDDVHVQLFSDDYIKEIGKLLHKAQDKIQVLTIAISPDCLAGKDIKEKWDNGFRVLGLLADKMYSLWEFPFQQIAPAKGQVPGMRVSGRQ